MVNKHPLPGSERTVEQGSKVVGQCDPAERIEVFVMLRRQQQAQFDALMSKIEAGDPSVKPLSRETLAKDYGAAPDDIAKVKAFATAHGLTVVREDPAARTVLLSGTIAQFQDAFAVKLEHYEHHSTGQFRGRTGTISVPDDLHGVVQAVLGLDDRPQARPHFRIRPPFQPARGHQVSFTPPQLASLYHFPQGDGGGQCVGIIELGGGYNTSDLKSYFASLGVASPKVKSVGVDQGSNQPTGDPNGPDGEVTLDIEIVGAIAPGATIAVYFTQNSDAGFIDAVSRAVHDTTNKPSVISISWGGPESNWTSQSLQAFNSAAVGGDPWRDGLRCVGRQRLERRRGQRRPGRLPGIEPVCAGLRRHEPHCVGHFDLARGGVERRRAGWCDRRRREPGLPGAGVAEGSVRHLDERRQEGARRARRAGRGGRRIARDRLQCIDRRYADCGRRHQRGRAAVGRADRAHQCGEGAAGRLHQPQAVQGERRVQRHHARQQRQFRGIRGLGRLHGARQSQWSEGGGRTIVCRTRPEGSPLGQHKDVNEDVNEPMERS